MDCLLDPFLQQHIVFSISSNKKFAQWPHSHIPRGLNPRSRGENTRHGYYESLRLGSSPLTRGKRDWDPTDPRHPRLIPAHAGKTTTVVGGVLSVAAHPRSRGENDVRDDDNRPFLGSSPLTRGKRSRPTRAGRGTSAHPRSRGENIIEQADPISPLGSSPLTRGKRPNQKEGDHHLGLIPAHAGKTPKMGRGRRPAPAHPRSRGENPLRWPLRDFDQGSSPLTRGKLVGTRHVGPSTGLIPAHAGKTSYRRVGLRSFRAHPRSRGENGEFITSCSPLRGSSPLTREKLKSAFGSVQSARLIPAHAGKTHQATCQALRTRAHPRSRGENCVKRARNARFGGSSPLTRGKRCTHHDTRGYLRLVPAHAGKTRYIVAISSPYAAHPRSRGENLKRGTGTAHTSGSSPLTRGKPGQVLQIEVGPRLIPAHAGKTRCLLRRLSRARAHPRSRGENDRDDINGATASGSSPLTRGKPRRWNGPRGGIGLIPAHAGKTLRTDQSVILVQAHPRSRGENGVL